MSSAGRWTVGVSDPYPSWVNITYAYGEQQKITGIHHHDLVDLHYAIGRAIKEARNKLPEPFKHEMD